MAEFKPSIVITEPNGQVSRLVDPKACVYIGTLIGRGDLTMEEGMRLLFPEEADRIYDLGRKR